MGNGVNKWLWFSPLYWPHSTALFCLRLHFASLLPPFLPPPPTTPPSQIAICRKLGKAIRLWSKHREDICTDRWSTFEIENYFSFDWSIKLAKENYIHACSCCFIGSILGCNMSSPTCATAKRGVTHLKLTSWLPKSAWPSVPVSATKRQRWLKAKPSRQEGRKILTPKLLFCTNDISKHLSSFDESFQILDAN